MTYQERQELNTLSKLVFGTSSRWQKIVNNGVAEPHSRDREVVIPGPSGLKTKIFTDTKNIVKHFNVAEVKKLMETILSERSKGVHRATNLLDTSDSLVKDVPVVIKHISET